MSMLYVSQKQDEGLNATQNPLVRSLLSVIHKTYSSDPQVLCRNIERTPGWREIIDEAKKDEKLQHPVFAVMQDSLFQASIPHLPTLAALCVARSVGKNLVNFPLQEADAALQPGHCYPCDHPLFQSAKCLLPVTFEKAGAGALLLHPGESIQKPHFSCALPLEDSWYVLGTINTQGETAGYVSHVARHVADFVSEAARVGVLGAITRDGQRTILSYHDGSEAVSLSMPLHAQWECTNKDRGIRFEPPTGDNEYVIDFYLNHELRKAAMYDAARTARVNSLYMQHVLSQLTQQCVVAQSILDLGGGREALFAKHFSKEAQYFLADYRVSQGDEKGSPSNVIHVRADLDRSDLFEESYNRLQAAGRTACTVEALIAQSDFILVANLLNYLEDWRGFIKRLGDNTQSGTTAVIQNAIGRGWSAVLADKRPRSNQDIYQCLKNNGFSLTHLYAVDPDPSRGRFSGHISPQLPKQVEQSHIVSPRCDEYEIVFFIAQKQ